MTVSLATDKAKIVKRYGNDIRFVSRATPYVTRAIVGSSVRKTSVRLADVEKFLRGNFLPQDHITNGEVIEHVVTGKKYMVLGMYPEVITGSHVMDLCNLLKVNVTYTCSRLVQKADGNGNKITEPVNIAVDTHAYAEPISDEMRETNIGLLENAEFLLYTSHLDIKVNDQISLDSNGIVRVMRVGAIDNIALEGVLILQLVTDVRGK